MMTLAVCVENVKASAFLLCDLFLMFAYAYVNLQMSAVVLHSQRPFFPIVDRRPAFN